MKTILKQNPHLINHLHKLIALIFGYLFWLILTQIQITKLDVEVPLYFYGLKNEHEIDAPEKIKATIAGKRKDLCKLDSKDLGAHFDISTLCNGTHNMDVANADFFLHKKFKMLDYSPKTFTLQINEKKVVA